MGTSNSQISAMQAFQSVPAIFAIVNRIAESVARAQWSLYQQETNGDRTLIDDATAPANHEATALWTHPNPFMTRQELVQTTQQHIELAGEGYWLLCEPGKTVSRFASSLRAPIEMWAIRPDRIQPVPDPDAYIIGYMYKGPGSEVVPLEFDSVVHLRQPNPLDPLTGYGPVQSMMSDIQAEKYASLYNMKLFENSAEPGGIIQFDTPLTDVDFERLVTRWREQHQGVANANRVAILERGTWVANRYTMRDMAFEKLRNVNRDIFLLAFGMHSSIMGISEGVNRANAEAAEVGFARWILNTRLERIKSAFNERVLPFIGERLTMDFDDPTPPDLASAMNIAVAGRVGGILTLNQALELVGQPQIDGPEGDQRLQQPAMLPSPPHVPTLLGVNDEALKLKVVERQLRELEEALA